MKTRDSRSFFFTFATLCGVIPSIIGYGVMQVTNSSNPELEARLRKSARPETVVTQSEEMGTKWRRMKLALGLNLCTYLPRTFEDSPTALNSTERLSDVALLFPLNWPMTPTPSSHGHPALIGRHRPFPVTHQAAERWLHHMQNALDDSLDIDKDSKIKMMKFFRHTTFFLVAGNELMNEN